MRRKTFRPPKVSDPPALVELHWVDAQGDTSDVEIEKAGGLIELPSVGYYVRHVKHGPHGPYIVIAMEIMKDQETGIWSCRQHTSIPLGWITRWAEVESVREIWPGSGGSSTSTSSTMRNPTKKQASPESTTSESETSAGVSPSASE